MSSMQEAFSTCRSPRSKESVWRVAGGPIRRDKIFVFGTFEMNTDRSQRQPREPLHLFTAELAGDFSYLNGRKQLVNPFNDNTPFPNNQIPRSLFDLASLTVLQYVPTVPNPGDRLQAFGDAPKDAKLFMIRNDILLTPKQTLFGHYYLNQNADARIGLAYGSDISGWTGQTQGPRNQTWA